MRYYFSTFYFSWLLFNCMKSGTTNATNKQSYIEDGTGRTERIIAATKYGKEQMYIVDSLQCT